MHLDAILKDAEVMQSHIFKHPEEAVRIWSNEICEDPQASLGAVIGFLMDAVPPVSIPCRPLQGRPEDRAAEDLIKRSNLNSILEVDSAEMVIRYRTGVPESVKVTIARFLCERATVLSAHKDP